jgi:ABC-type dipeptide/oligopeptide/nickel transport system ATPase component
LIAMSIMHRPALLLADEPTSALDVITQAEILELFGRLSRDMNMAVLFISHDLPSVVRLCQRVAILHAGEIVEVAKTSQIFEAPRHPYTQRLVAALAPRLGTSQPSGLALSV